MVMATIHFDGQWTQHRGWAERLAVPQRTAGPGRGLERMSSSSISSVHLTACMVQQYQQHLSVQVGLILWLWVGS